MMYSFKELLLKYGTRYNIEQALKNKAIYKQANNIYSDERIVNPMLIVTKKYPHAIITMDSAFYYYNLTDVIPSKVHIATNRNSNGIKNEKIVQNFMSKDILNYGKTSVNIEGISINIYDKERLLIELIRKRAKIPFDYYKEIISNYRNIADELDMYKIEEYVSLFKNGENLFDILQKEVF